MHHSGSATDICGVRKWCHPDPNGEPPRSHHPLADSITPCYSVVSSYGAMHGLRCRTIRGTAGHCRCGLRAVRLGHRSVSHVLDVLELPVRGHGHWTVCAVALGNARWRGTHRHESAARGGMHVWPRGGVGGLAAPRDRRRRCGVRARRQHHPSLAGSIAHGRLHGASEGALWGSRARGRGPRALGTSGGAPSGLSRSARSLETSGTSGGFRALARGRALRKP